MNSLVEQARPSAKTGKVSRIDKITAALTQIDQGGDIPECIVQTPGAFLRECYEAWLENGGLVGGKNRNSVRKMRNWLTGDAEVRSLHPKLTGRVRITRNDASALIDLFLSRWKYVGVKRGNKGRTGDGYAPFPCGEVDVLRDTIVDAMFPPAGGRALRGLLLPALPSTREPAKEAQETWDAVTDMFAESDAVMTLSRHRTTIGATPAETMENFWRVLRYLKDKIGDKDVILVWIIDIGSRQVEDPEAWPDFYNFEVLKAQFRSFATFDSADHIDDDQNIRNDEEPSTQIHDAFLRLLEIPEESSRERQWRWLCEHAVVLVLNLRKEEFEEIHSEEDRDSRNLRLKDIGVTTEHILPSALPHRWGTQLPEFYGKEIHDITDATLTVLFKMSGWNEYGDAGSGGQRTDLRYFAHALVPKEARGTNVPLNTAKSRELSSPGGLYDEAFRIVYWAARHRLKEWRGTHEGYERDWAIAIAYLRKLGFQVLRLPDFLRVHRLPGDQ